MGFLLSRSTAAQNLTCLSQPDKSRSQPDGLASRIPVIAQGLFGSTLDGRHDILDGRQATIRTFRLNHPA
jgi:hypothetical protein